LKVLPYKFHIPVLNLAGSSHALPKVLLHPLTNIVLKK
jgi:hypothetical protein